ncbi:DNA polymerase III subunit beta [Spirosoma sordidisoli]|uniref:Beta sliding clamp n=1 Tax=Spirosoma sordidisoli TaxID=2502893 RepID=A0A4Q2UN52_9BACT|nr:DNA polymerase III subunit beta [Spirosoma sordidisoli]RYC70746.1 hypothetical protein EQG79_00910 [Spirosoma sordidisoli]
MTTETVVSTSAIVASSVMRHAMSRLLPVVSINPIIPIVENMLVTVREDLLTLHVSDLHREARAIIPAETDVFGTDTTQFCVPFRELYRLLVTLPEQPITIRYEAGESRKLSILAVNGEYEFLSLEDPLDFPKPLDFKPTTSFTAPLSEFKALMRLMKPFISTDDLRPAMTGIHWQCGGALSGGPEPSHKGHELVATDGHSIVRVRPTFPTCDPFAVIVPLQLVSTLAQLPDKGDNPTIAINKSKDRPMINVSFGMFSYTARCIDERFPDYPNVLTDIKPTATFQLGRVDFISSLKRALIFSNRITHQFKLSVASVNWC